MTNTNTNRYNRDKFTCMNMKRATISTMTIIDAVQLLTPEEQLTGISASFILLCERYGMEPQDVFTITKNIMNGADGRVPEFKAVAAYMENELN